MQFSWQGELLSYAWLVHISLSKVYVWGTQNQLSARNVYEMTFYYYAQFVSFTAYWSVVLEHGGYVQKQTEMTLH